MAKNLPSALVEHKLEANESAAESGATEELVCWFALYNVCGFEVDDDVWVAPKWLAFFLLFALWWALFPP